MSVRYTRPSCESIIEDSEGESEGESEDRRDGSPTEAPRRQSRPPAQGPSMKGGQKKEKARSRRTQKSTSGGKHSSRPKPKNDPRRPVGIYTRETGSNSSQRPPQEPSHRSNSSRSSSEEEEEPEQDHRAVLEAARARLTSPSMLSTFTMETTVTNKSSSSSGSNSTITQSSVGKRSPGKEPEVTEPDDDTTSPAAPDPPAVFDFIDRDRNDEQLQSEHEDEDDDESESEGEPEEESGEDDPSDWTPPSPPSKSALTESSLPLTAGQASSSSSASNSLHGDDAFSEPAADNDTDRSTSPERSVEGKHEGIEAPQPPPADDVSAKIRSQMAAAQQRQHYYAMHQYGVPGPEMPRGNARPPCDASTVSTARYQPPPPSPSTVSTSRYQQPSPPCPSTISTLRYQPPPIQPYPQPQYQQQYALQRIEDLPVTGYELLATRLSSDERGPRIRPMYRKFEALNHRLLLHLQDELSELEEQLRRLDVADTQSRCMQSNILPASRRLSAQAGGQLEWHKVDILGRIGFKLAQYNQALASFNQTQLLQAPDPDDIDQYRSYLQTEHPIEDSETHFLDPTEDLVAVIPETEHHHSHRHHRRQKEREQGNDETSSNISSRSSASQPPRPRSHLSCTSPSPFSPTLSSSHLHISTSTSDISQTSSKATSAPSSPIPTTIKFQTLALSLTISILLPVLTFTVIRSLFVRIIVTVLLASAMLFSLVHAGIVRDMDVEFRREGLLYLGLYLGGMGVVACCVG